MRVVLYRTLRRLTLGYYLNSNSIEVFRVLEDRGTSYLVYNEARGAVTASARGALMKSSWDDHPTVGDWVEGSIQPGDWISVERVVNRRSLLHRRSASGAEPQRLGANVDTLMILTAVPRVSVNFGKPDQRELDVIHASELKQFQSEGHFAKGSMGPKIEAALSFIAGGGKRAIIGHLEEALAALEGRTGTHVVAG